MKAEAPRTLKYSRLTRRVFTSSGGLPSTLALCLSNALCAASIPEKAWVRSRKASNSRVERLLRSPVEAPDADASGGRVGERNQLLRIFDRQQLEEDGIDQAEDGGIGADAKGQRHHRDGGKTRRLGQHASAREHVLPQLFKARHTHILDENGLEWLEGQFGCAYNWSYGTHTIEATKRLLNRVWRIKGQVTAIEKALDHESECSEILHNIAAFRGAMDALMAEVIDGHIRFHILAAGGPVTDKDTFG